MRSWIEVPTWSVLKTDLAVQAVESQMPQGEAAGFTKAGMKAMVEPVIEGLREGSYQVIVDTDGNAFIGTPSECVDHVASLRENLRTSSGGWTMGNAPTDGTEILARDVDGHFAVVAWAAAGRLPNFEHILLEVGEWLRRADGAWDIADRFSPRIVEPVEWWPLPGKDAL